MRKSWISILILTLAIIFTTGIHASANLNELGKRYSGTINDENTSDIYIFELLESGTLELDLESDMNDLEVLLKDSSGEKIVEPVLFGGKPELPIKKKQIMELEPGTYSVEVEQDYFKYDGKYSLTASFIPSKATEKEPNNSKETAEKINLPHTGTVGFLSWNDDVDYYAIDIKQAGKISLSVSSYFKEGIVDFNLSSAATGKDVFHFENFGNERDLPKINVLSQYVEPGLYYLAVKDDYNGRGKYEFNLTHKAAGNIEIEGNNGTSTAQKFPGNGSIKGLISWNDIEDYYKLRVKSDTKINLKFTSYFSGETELLDENGDYLQGVKTLAGKEETAETDILSYSLKANKDYYLKVSGSGYGEIRGIYTLSIPELQPAGANFQDVPSFYGPAVDYLLSNNITKGMSSAEFGTTKHIKRADAAVWLAKALNLDTSKAKASGFNDVPSRAVGAVNALKQAGIINGKSLKSFGSDDSLTRGEIAIILQRAYKLSGNGSSVPFKDVGSRYKEAVNALVSNGVTNGISDTAFGVSQNVTRGQLAVFMYRVSNK